MTHKDFLTELHKLSKIDKQLVSALVSALCRVLSEEAIAGNVVEIDGLGQFVSHKHPEYIKTDDETGETILFPPRISYRFSSLKNFTQSNPAAPLLAEYADVTEELASDFLRCFTNVISAKVKDGEEVEVQGLGVFVVVDTQQAEMRRMALILSEKMKREVNAPFSYFEPYVISKGISPEKEFVTESEQEDAMLETVVEENTAMEEPVQSEEEETSQLIELPVEQDKTQGEESAEEVTPQEKKSSNIWRFILPVLFFVFLFVLYRMLWSSNLEPIAEVPPVVVEEEKADTLQEESINEEIPELTENEKKNENIEIVKFAQPVPSEGIHHRMLDSLGNPVTIKLLSGDRLTLLALKHLGSKDFWPYIFDVNSDRLTSPNKIAAGMTLYLPDPEYFDIDLSSETSIKKARQRAYDINMNNK